MNLKERLETIRRQIEHEERRLNLFRGANQVVARQIIARLRLREAELLAEIESEAKND